MALEPITRQEQIIAGKDLEPITRMERFLKEYGGASSWNDLTDKPFGNLPTGGDTLTWDGNTDGLDSFLMGGGMSLYKVSDVKLTLNDYKDGIIAVMGGNEIPVSAEAIQEVALTDGFFFYDAVMFVPHDNYEIPDSDIQLNGGIYLYSDATDYASSLIIPGFTGFPSVKKIDSKYLPDTKTLYVSTGEQMYIYTDIACTAKATRTDLDPFFMGQSDLLLIYSYEGTPYGRAIPTSCFIDTKSGALGLETLRANSDGTVSSDNFYTAEYTGE